MTTATHKIVKKNFDSPDAVRSCGHGKMQLASLEDTTLARVILNPGWKWSEHIRPMVKTDYCETAHLQYVISGRLMVVMEDGSKMELGPGDFVDPARPRRLGAGERAVRGPRRFARHEGVRQRRPRVPHRLIAYPKGSGDLRRLRRSDRYGFAVVQFAEIAQDDLLAAGDFSPGIADLHLIDFDPRAVAHAGLDGRLDRLAALQQIAVGLVARHQERLLAAGRRRCGRWTSTLV